jgi:lysyl-tRNA synthetase class 2
MHNPDFTSLEFYWAYADYKDMMKLIERMFENLLKKIFGKLEINYEGKKINFKPPWPRIEFNQLLRKYAKINLDEIHLEALKEKAKKLGIEMEAGAGKAQIADEIYKKFCLPKIWQPTFVIHHPREKCSLAKRLEKDPEKIASLQLVAGGIELVWAYSELNDPIDQRKRFEEQEKLMEAGFQEAHPLDEDFIEALEYGMPPAAGFGMGIDRLAALLTDSHSLREVILFPTMRPK